MKSAPGFDIVSIFLGLGVAMSLSKGDKVTLSISPVVNVTKYDRLKPHASVTFDIGENPDCDIDAAEKELRMLACRAMLLEAELTCELQTAMDSGDGAFRAFLEKETNRGNIKKDHTPTREAAPRTVKVKPKRYGGVG